jgi:cytochrome c biogenesis protein CcdA
MINTAALALAFTAGLVATVNPCGFAMVPAYLGYFMGNDADSAGSADGRPARIARALRIGLMVSSGFIVVFGLAGVALTLGLQSLIDVLPWLALAVGVAVLVLGLAMVRGFHLNVRIPTVRGAKKQRTNRSMFLFGVSYAVASLSCTLPVFLSLIPANLSQASLIGGSLTFIVYGLGMSAVLMVITLAVALGRDSMVKRLRSSARYINTVSGFVLIAAGGFIIWYWSTILASGGTAAGQNGVVRFVDELSASATDLIGSNARGVGALLTLALGGAALSIMWRQWFSPGAGSITETESGLVTGKVERPNQQSGVRAPQGVPRTPA